MSEIKPITQKTESYFLGSNIYMGSEKEETIISDKDSVENVEEKLSEWCEKEDKRQRRRKKPEERRLSYRQELGRILEVLETLALDRLGVSHLHTDYENYSYNRKGCDKFIPEFQGSGETKNINLKNKLYHLFVKKHIISRYPKKALLKWHLISSKKCLLPKSLRLLKKNKIHIIEAGEQVTEITEELIEKIAEQFKALFATLTKTSILLYVYHSSVITYLHDIFDINVDDLQLFSTRYRKCDYDFSDFTVDLLDDDISDTVNDNIYVSSGDSFTYYDRLCGLSKFYLMDKIAHRLLNTVDRSSYEDQVLFISHQDIDDHSLPTAEQKSDNFNHFLKEQVRYG